MWLYNIAIIIYSLLIRFASLWIPKAKLWCDGRRDIFERMAATISPSDRILWVHVASLGEFEQGRPIIEKIRAEHPEFKILLTFYSPSGYELRKNYEGADYIFYLPADTPRNARRFVECAHPEIAIFVKYEFWINTLTQLRKQGVRTYIVSAIFHPKSIFFRWYGFYWRRALTTFSTIFVQNEESKKRLSQIGFEGVMVAGDTRFDRVAQIATSSRENKIVERFKGESRMMIAGSTWPLDEDILLPLVEKHQELKFVVAPHEIDDDRVSALAARFGGAVRYTQVEKGASMDGAQVLILDTMGQLSSIYRYASWAYIGGGFGVGIHNTLEASTFGLPMAFGPNYHKFKEATDMVKIGACCSVSDAAELEAWFTPLTQDEELRQKVSQKTKDYTQLNQGATKIITTHIFE